MLKVKIHEKVSSFKSSQAQNLYLLKFITICDEINDIKMSHVWHSKL